MPVQKPTTIRRRPASGPPKVLFVMASYAVGGTELQLASLIADRPAWASGYALESITFLPPRSAEVAERFASLGVVNTLIDREQTSFPRFFLRLLQQVRRSRPDILHAMLDSSTGAWGRLAGVVAGVPAIVQSDRSIVEEGTSAHLRLRPFLDGRTKRFLPNAHAIAERLRRSGVPAERITVVPSGVDLGRFDPDKLQGTGRFRRHPGEVVAGFVGRFHAVKRIDVLLEAVASLPEGARPDRLVLAGDGPEASAVRELVAEHEWLREHVELIGTCTDVPAFLAETDYLILSSEVEGAPNAVIEAMAMRRPVVATRVSDVPTIVGETGFLADPGDVASLAAAIAAMQGLAPGARAELGAAARGRVERDYDIRVVSERFWEAHRQLLPEALR